MSETESPSKQSSTKSSKLKSKSLSKPISISQRSGLQFPVSRVHRKFKNSMTGCRVGIGASVYLSAVLEYLTAEIIELAGYEAHDKHRQRITPQHIQLAVRCDQELHDLLSDVTIAEGGVLPNIQSSLLPKDEQRFGEHSRHDMQRNKSSQEI